ncbi:MAG: hypothetical protein QW491_10875 [Thermoproteota archaeon]|nr:hypothetical protein [Candidatus Brockarchaeota archaeon]
MENSLFQSYSRKHVHFYGREVPALLELGLALTRDISEKPMMVDLGCGDGRLIFAMYRKELLIVLEIKRLVESNGLAYVSSVIKK